MTAAHEDGSLCMRLDDGQRCRGVLRRVDPEHAYPHEWMCPLGHRHYGRSAGCLRSTPWPEVSDGDFAASYAEGYVRATYLCLSAGSPT